MNTITNQKKNNRKPYDFHKDFKILSPKEKRVILKTAKTYWKLLKDNDLISNVLPIQTETEKQGIE